MTRLWTVEQAAAELGVPKASLRAAAARHGMLVRIGRAVRLDPDTFEELLSRCRESQKAPASGGALQKMSGLSVIPESRIGQQAQQIAERLKGY